MRRADSIRIITSPIRVVRDYSRLLLAGFALSEKF